MNHFLADRLIFSRIKSGLGLGSSLGFWAAAAPVSVDTHEYFLSLDMRIYEIYGEKTGISFGTLMFGVNL